LNKSNGATASKRKGGIKGGGGYHEVTLGRAWRMGSPHLGGKKEERNQGERSVIRERKEMRNAIISGMGKDNSRGRARTLWRRSVFDSR